MIICNDQKSIDSIRMITARLSNTEIVGQTSEECAELIRATQKYRRLIAGTTPMTWDEIRHGVTEEVADVLLCVDALLACRIVNQDEVQDIALQKLERWHDRTFGGEKKGE